MIDVLYNFWTLIVFIVYQNIKIIWSINHNHNDLFLFFFSFFFTLEKAKCSYKTNTIIRVSSTGIVAEPKLGDASQLIQGEHK